MAKQTTSFLTPVPGTEYQRDSRGELYDKYGVPVRTPEQKSRLDKLAETNKKYPTRSSMGQYETVNPTMKWQYGESGPELKQVGTDTETGTVAGRKEFQRYEKSDYKNVDPDRGRDRRSRIVNSRQVTNRDATIAKSAKQTLAERAGKYAEKTQPKGPNILNNPILAVAELIAEADKATDYKRVKYTGNFGGPSFSTNPYASTTLSKQIMTENRKKK